MTTQRIFRAWQRSQAARFPMDWVGMMLIALERQVGCNHGITARPFLESAHQRGEQEAISSEGM